MYKELTRAEGGRALSIFNSKWGKDRIRNILEKEDAKIHFIGAGGVSMYSLLNLSRHLGLTVSGSDKEASRLTERLLREGVSVSCGHLAENAEGKSLIVYTLAIDGDNPELVYAHDNGIPTVSRAEYLGALMEKYKTRIGVSGAHGKSTVTAMLDAIFCHAGKSPTTLCGASIPKIDAPIRIGEREYFIYEACEYKDSFLSFSPTLAVFTNLEYDHVDYFNNIEALKASFLSAMDISEVSVINADDKRLAELIKKTKSRVITVGRGEDADFRYSVSGSCCGYYSFTLYYKDKSLDVALSVPGDFNVTNAACAMAAALEIGISERDVCEAICAFCGIERRMEKIGCFGTVPVYYDYAHHPTEIECTVNTAREMTGGPVTVIFKPHTYSRTAGLLSDFVRALSQADRVLLCEISAIRECAIDGVSSELIVSLIGEKAAMASEENVIEQLRGQHSGAIIIMGAANLDAVKENILGK